MNIHRHNFRSYFNSTFSYLLFLSICILSQLLMQRALKLESSTRPLRFVELHLVGATKMVTEMDFRFGPLFVAEMMWVYFYSLFARQLYCISRELTMLELEKPYLFVHSRLDSLFQLRKSRAYNIRSKKKKYYYSYIFRETGMCRMISNVARFLVCCTRGVSARKNK